MSSNQTISVDEALARAKKALKKGDYQLAGQLFSAVLQAEPANAQARKGIRKLQKQGIATGKVPPSDPTQEELSALLGIFHAGQPQLAESRCRELLQAHPQSVMVLNLLAGSLMQQQKFPDAISAFEQAMKIKPDFAEGYSNMSTALLELGRPRDAIDCCDRAIEINPGLADAYCNKGNALKVVGRTDEAAQLYRKAINIAPNMVQAHNNLGTMYELSGDTDAALACWEKAISLNPDYPDPYNNLANICKERGEYSKALDYYSNAIRLNPRFAEAYNNRAGILIELGRYEEALANWDQSVALDSSIAQTHNNRGNVLNVLGRTSEALTSYEKALEVDPGFADAHYNLSTLKTYDESDPHRQQMENLLRQPGLTDDDQVKLYHALGNAYEHLGEFETSYRYIEKANSINCRKLNYDVNMDRARVRTVKQMFNGPVETLPDVDGGEAKPLLIVGMPRSGTTLVEQILASHSQVYGAGELEILSQIMEPMLAPRINSGSTAPLTADETLSIRHRYLEVIRSLDTEHPFITDKMPLNFRWLGFFLTAFPEAKVIHLNRDPVAVCWSIYKRYFQARGNAYGNSLSDLVTYYQSYVEIMDYWRTLFPGKIHDVFYEALTENQEKGTRELLEFCDLGWEDQCLRFYENDRAVRTASSLQVRQKMYTGSSESWKNYEPFLGELIKGLEGLSASP